MKGSSIGILTDRLLVKMPNRSCSCVCVCVCVHAYVCACERARVRVCVRAYACVHASGCASVRPSVRACVRACEIERYSERERTLFYCYLTAIVGYLGNLDCMYFSNGESLFM